MNDAAVTAPAMTPPLLSVVGGGGDEVVVFVSD